MKEDKKDKIFDWIGTAVVFAAMLVLWFSVSLFNLDIPERTIIVVLYLIGVFLPFWVPALKIEESKE